MALELWTILSLHISPLPPSCWKLYSRQVWPGTQDLLSYSNQSRDMASHQEGQANSISHFLHSEFQRFNSWWVCLPPSSHSKDEGSTIREAGWVYWDLMCLALTPSGGPAPEVVPQRFWHLTRRGRCHNLVRCHIPQRSFLEGQRALKHFAKEKTLFKMVTAIR